MRRALLSAVVILAASCGGSPMAPSSPSGTPQAGSSLPSGAYTLTVTMATTGTSGFSTCASAGINTVPAFTGVVVPIPVSVEHTGSAVAITPEDQAATFRMQLQFAGANLSGTASGQFTSGATVVTVTGGLSGGNVAAARGVAGLTSVTGVIDGTISVQSTSCMNNGHTWQLARR